MAQQPNYPMVDPYGMQAMPQPYQANITSSMIDPQASADLISWMMDPKQEIEELKMQLRGYVIEDRYDKVTGKPSKVATKVSEPLINELGINKIIYKLNLKLGKYFATTRLSGDEIRKMTLQFNMDLIFELMERWQDHGMDYSDIMGISNSITQIVFASLKRSEDGFLMRRITETYKEVHSVNQGMNMNPQQRKGAFRNFLGI